jgi:4-alpha-glucanotransferase
MPSIKISVRRGIGYARHRISRGTACRALTQGCNEENIGERLRMHNMLKTLKILSNACGIEPHYFDATGKIRYTDPETARRVLESKGISIPRERLQLNPQVLVLSSNELPERCTVYFAEKIIESDLASPEGTVRISGLDEAMQGIEFPLGSDLIRFGLDDETGLLRVSIPFPRQLGLGTHRVRVDVVAAEHALSSFCLWIVCPPRAYAPRAIEEGKKLAGVQVALYGIRSETNWGIGDFSDLVKIIDWAAKDLSVDVVGLNPLHALFNRRPYNSSPYLPSSRLFRNFIYLDVPGIEDAADSPAVQSLLDSAEVGQKTEKLRYEEYVNYEEVSALKLRVLRQIFAGFMENHGRLSRRSTRWSDFEAYIASEGEYLDRFATFCALDEHFRGLLHETASWREWPEEFHSPLSDEVKEFQREHQQEILFWMYLQWQIDAQLKKVQDHAVESGMIVGLYNDEALAVDRNGADFWAWREFFHEGFRVGAPPDDFAREGQDWGFPPPDRDRMRSAGYELFLKKLQANCKHGGALRIDHVMQFHHLFWIPADGKPVDGLYVQDYESDLLNLVALESQNSGTLIIGEDLGTVPPNFRERLMAKGIFSSRLLYFERDGGGKLLPRHVYPEGALVSITTHDLPTLAGFWSGCDAALRLKIGLLDELSSPKFREDRSRHKARIIERLAQDDLLTDQAAQIARESELPTDELHSAVLDFVLGATSRLVIINQEDIFLDVRQQNLPSTTWENPNWVTKMLYSIEELRSNPEAMRLAGRFRESVERWGRSRRREG